MMRDKKVFILAAILLLLVGVYAYYSQKIQKATKSTEKPVDIAKIDPDFQLKSKVIKGVKAYMREHGDAPPSFDRLQGKYLDAQTYKLALEKKMQYTYLGKNKYRISMSSKTPTKLASKRPDTKKKPGASTSSSTPTELATTDTGWKYDPTGKPDPFKPFILASAAPEESPVVVHRQLTPLQKMPLSEIQAGLKAIIWGQLGSKALVEDATGKGYVVQEGTYVGQHDGIVKKIYQDRIIVEEYRRDPAKGRLEPTEVVLRLKKVEKE
jgi:Tfp pilus assembly protein PilP